MLFAHRATNAYRLQPQVGSYPAAETLGNRTQTENLSAHVTLIVLSKCADIVIWRKRRDVTSPYNHQNFGLDQCIGYKRATAKLNQGCETESSTLYNAAFGGLRVLTVKLTG